MKVLLLQKFKLIYQRNNMCSHYIKKQDRKTHATSVNYENLSNTFGIM